MSETMQLRRSVPVAREFDVIVVGGGPAGCTAAAAAAREGASTLLIEATASLGGMGTSGLVPAWCPFSDREKIIYKGLAEKVFAAAKSGMAHVKPDAMDWVPIDPERLKRVYDDLVLDHGGKLLFNTVLSAVESDEAGRASAIIVTNKAGMSAYRAKVFVDCTGDADLAAWAGAEFHKGDEEGKNLQPATHCFVLSNVNDDAYRTGPELHAKNPTSPIFDILRSGKYPAIPDAHMCQNSIGPGTVGFNAGHVFNIDNTDPATTSRGVVEGRRIAAAYRDALAEHFPAAFGNAFLVTTGSLIGIRETRRIVGDYILTLQDYIDRRGFDDEICRNCYFIDVHNKVKEAAQTYAGMQNAEKRTLAYGPGESHGIPYRCLTPKTLRNVLVAGRSISCDQLVQGSVRVMPVCLAMGEAAGMAAAHAAESQRIDVHVVSTERLRRRLREEGAFLPQ